MPKSPPANALGTIYLLHFDRPYRHARHYTGWTEDLLDRLDRHATGHGARLVEVIWQAGIGFTLVRVSEGTRHTERAIKNAGGAVRLLPGLHPPAAQRPLDARDRRPHSPHLPQPGRKAVTPCPAQHHAARNQRNNPYAHRRPVRQLPPQRRRRGVAVAHRTGHPHRYHGRAVAARHS